MKQKKMLIAHRGLSATYPENTLPAFEQALKLNIDAIEFDVRMTRDGVPVLSHDERIDRCGSGKTGLIRDFTFEELRKLDFGAWKSPEFAGTRIPTLFELLDLVDSRRPDLFLCVELKEDDCRCARLVIEELKRRIGSTTVPSSAFAPKCFILSTAWTRACSSMDFAMKRTLSCRKSGSI